MSINPANPKWLEILKASGWQTGALALAAASFIVLVKAEIIPTTDNPLWITIPAIVLLICGFLALASIGDALTQVFKPRMRFSEWQMMRHERKKTREYIPYMTEQDKKIIGYLLHHNQQTFQGDQDGGYAAPMISKGIIRNAAITGQLYLSDWTPFEIAPHIWKVLEDHREQFPYKPPPKGKPEVHPWAIHWMVK